MLEQILDHIHNYFIKEVFKGEFVISSNSISLPFLQDEQYFYIKGSIFNDGLHQYPTDKLHDETFVGEIWAMAIPPALISLSYEITDWIAKYGEIVNSPYSSESFGGYSYTKAFGSSSENGNSPQSWQSVFRSKLNKWRKII